MTPMLAMSYEVGNDVILGALLVGLVIFAGGLIASMGVIKGWIREVAGVKETTTTEIAGQPISVIMAKEFVTLVQFKEEMSAISKSMTADRTENRHEHENLFSKLGGQERGINGNLRDLDRKVAALDERTLTTNSTLNIQGQKLDRILERLKA